MLTVWFLRPLPYRFFYARMPLNIAFSLGSILVLAACSVGMLFCNFAFEQTYRPGPWEPTQHPDVIFIKAVAPPEP